MPIENVDENLPTQVRVSLGSAITLRLLDGKFDAPPMTAYLMTYRRGKCTANCQFCPQARKSRSRTDMLSRITWPVFATRRVLDEIQDAAENDAIRRVCIQALNYHKVFAHLEALVRMIKKGTNVPISISCQPLVKENLKLLADAGAERIGVPLDAATEELFDKVKGASAGGPYNWRKQFGLLEDAVSIFGKGRVSTHLIVGLGETEHEIVGIIQKCVDMGVLPALFAFTPVSGTGLEKSGQPPISKYRRVQMARSLIVHGATRIGKMNFSEEGQVINFGVGKQTLKEILWSGEPFLTSGCPDCNRPYYNEKPRGPIYNFPRDPSEKELGEIQEQLSPSGA